MRHRALLIGVLVPAALSHAFYGAFTHRDHRDHREVRFERTRVSADFGRPPRPHGFRGARSGRCAVREVRALSAPADARGRIALETRTGELEMDGVPGLDRVEVEATLC